MKPHITEAELQVLKILWEQSPSHVKSVHERLNKKKHTGYTTTLKIMQIMAQKALLSVDKSARQHVYTPILEQQEVQKSRLSRFLENTFGGSASSLVMQLLSHEDLTEKELQEIKACINTLENDDMGK